MDKEKKMEVHMGAVESAVDHIAYVRRLAEESGEDMEEFDRNLDTLCKQYHDKYAKMCSAELAIKGLMDIVQAGKGEEFLADFLEGKE